MRSSCDFMKLFSWIIPRYGICHYFNCTDYTYIPENQTMPREPPLHAKASVSLKCKPGTRMNPMRVRARPIRIAKRCQPAIKQQRDKGQPYTVQDPNPR